jgi:hypothetical protein
VIESLPIFTTQFPALLPEGVAMLDAARPHNAAVARRADPAGEPLTIGVFVRHAGHAGRPVAADLVPIGCAAVVEEVVRERGQLLGLRVRGLARVELLELAVEGTCLFGQVRVLDAPVPVDAFLAAQFARVKARLAGSGLSLEPELQAVLAAIDDPGRYADLLAGGLAELSIERRLALLTTTRPSARLELVDALVGERAQAPASELGRVWAALRGASNAIAGFSALQARAQDVDRASVQDPRLGRVVDELLRRRPILEIDVDDSREDEARRESLLELTAALPVLESLRECAGPDDAALEGELAAAVAFLHAAVIRERQAGEVLVH